MLSVAVHCFRLMCTNIFVLYSPYIYTDFLTSVFKGKHPPQSYFPRLPPPPISAPQYLKEQIEQFDYMLGRLGAGKDVHFNAADAECIFSPAADNNGEAPEWHGRWNVVWHVGCRLMCLPQLSSVLGASNRYAPPISTAPPSPYLCPLPALRGLQGGGLRRAPGHPPPPVRGCGAGVGLALEARRPARSLLGCAAGERAWGLLLGALSCR